MDAPFVHRRRITFGDTDAAGIVYTPRAAHFGVEAIEAWLLERLGIVWSHMILHDRMGTPFVRLEVDFISPMAPPDELATEVRLERAGRSSLTFRLAGRIGDRLCWRGCFVCAFISVETQRSIPIPEAYRDAIGRELAIGTAPEGGG
jgi:acyl-CoA thioesterase FadM